MNTQTPDFTPEANASYAENRAIAAEQAIGARNQDARKGGRDIEDIDPEAARRMAHKDLDDLRKLEPSERLYGAAIVIHDNMRNAAYKNEFQRIDFETAKAVELLAQQADIRIEAEASKNAAHTADDATTERSATEHKDDTEAANALGESSKRVLPGNDFVAPEMLRNHYLNVKNKYYFREDESKLAFKDKGERLATRHNDPEVARSMVALAKAKGWDPIKIKGKKEFKREVWLQASLNGIKVQGYRPSDIDRAKLGALLKDAEHKADKSLNSNEQAPDPARHVEAKEGSSKAAQRDEPVDRSAVVDEHRRGLSEKQHAALEGLKTVLCARGDTEKVISMAVERATERFQANHVYVGKVLEKGAAPYENDLKNEKSYYVKLHTEAGEKIVWGVDLARTMEKSQVKVGDKVALAYQGRHQDTVKVKERDEQGKVIGKSEVTTNRITWGMRKFETIRDEDKQNVVEATSRAGRQPQVKVYDQNAPRKDVRSQVVHETMRENKRVRG